MTGPLARLLTWRTRTLTYVSDAILLTVVGIFAARPGHQWSWEPCVLAPVLVAVGTGAVLLLVRTATRMLGPTDEQQARLAGRLLLLLAPVLLPGAVTYTVAIAVAAGSIPSWWPDVALGVILFLGGVLPTLLLMPRVRRQARALRTAHPTGSP